MRSEVIGGQLAKIGMEVEVNAFSKSNFFPDMDAGKFSIFMGGWGTDNVSASMNALFHSKGDGFGGTNRARYSNPRDIGPATTSAQSASGEMCSPT